MSFFLKEKFNLPGGAFQDGINTATDGNGIVYQDGTYGYIETSANADNAIIVSDALEIRDFANKTIKWTFSYQLTSLTASDQMATLIVTQSEDAPVIGTLGSTVLYLYLYNSAGTYYERWRYRTGATNYYYNGAAWNVTSTNNVREIDLATTYTITVTWHPDSKTFSVTNGTQSTETGAIDRDSYDWYWMVGEYSTAYYGSLLLNYLYVEKSGGLIADLTPKNALLTDGFVKGLFDGGDLIISNKFMEDELDGFYIENELRDYDWSQEDLAITNRLGELSQFHTRPTIVVTLDGIDITSRIKACTLDQDEGASNNALNITVGKIPNLRVFTRKDANYKTARIAVTVDGNAEGTYLIERVRESVSWGNDFVDIECRSLTALLDRPYSLPMSETWDVTTTRSGIVDDVVDGLVTVDYGIQDATVLANVYSCKKATPIEVIKDVLEATGGEMVTDYQDQLIIYYKPFDNTDKVPVIPINSSVVESLTVDPTTPTGENSVSVSKFDSGGNSTRFASLRLLSDKTTISSDGEDFATLTVRVTDENGSSPDIELIEDEVCQASQPHKISVANYIPKSANETPWGDKQGGEVIGIWDDELHTTKIAGPYTWDGNEIETTGAMDNNTDYYVTYRGADLISWTIDGDGDLIDEETEGDRTIYWEDVIRDGTVTKKLMARQGASGYIEIIANYQGQESNEGIALKIAVDDPRVGSVELSADPSTVSRGSKTSELRAVVVDPDGASIADGFEVGFEVQNGEGAVSPVTANTGSETLEEEFYALSKTVIMMNARMVSINSIYFIQNGIADTKVDYSAGATIGLDQITLAIPLAIAPCWVRINYVTGGIAKSTYTSPAITYDGVSHPSQRVGLIALCGGKPGYTEIELGGVEYDFGPPKGNESNWVYMNFPDSGVGSFTGDATRKVFTLPKQIPMMPGATLEIDFLKQLNCVLTKSTGEKYTIITCTVEAVYVENGENVYGEENVRGWRQVLSSADGAGYKQNQPVPNVAVSIAWNDGDTEDLETDASGIFRFEEGVVGNSKITFTKTDFDESTQTISISGGTPGTSEPGVEYIPVFFQGKLRYRWNY